MSEGDIRVEASKLYDLGVRTFMSLGMTEEHARMSADVLITADLRGIESHGFARLNEMYVPRIRDGRISPTPEVKVLQETATTATLDGDHGAGFIPGTMAMRMAIEKAREAGLAMVAVRNSSHYGPGSSYVLMALAQEMIGISMSSAGLVATTPGGAKRSMGSNVLAFAAPSRPPEVPFVLDMATSVVAAGKFEIAGRRGLPVPAGWGIDADGRPIESDPEDYLKGGAILPLGGDIEHGAWKGFGLAVMVDILSGVLSGGHSSAEIKSPWANHFFAAIRIDAFTELETFYDQMASMKQALRDAPRLPEAPPLTFPGEPEAQKEADYRQHGIPFHPATIASLKQMCAELSIEYGLD